MDSVLLDTSIASILHPKKKDTPLRFYYEPFIKGNRLILSFQSIAELYLWAEANHWNSDQRRGLDLFINRFFVIHSNPDLAVTWGQIQAYARNQGHPLESGDAWIAATALYLKIPLITHDRDFIRLEIPQLKIISQLS